MRRTACLVATALVLSAPPAAAAAASRYVDAETGADSNPACPLASPCATITYAVANSASSDAIRVDNGSYPEGVTLGDGRSVEFQNFVPGDGTGPAIVDGGAGTAITVASSGASFVRDLTLRGDAAGIQLSGPAEVSGNTFDDPDGPGAAAINASSSADGSSIHDNEILDPSPSATRARYGVFAPFTALEIVDNSFSGLNFALQVSGPASGTVLIEGNEVTGTHDLPFAGRAMLINGGAGGPVIIRENTISDAADSVVDGIDIGGAGTVSLVRNELSGQRDAIVVENDTTGVTLEGDRMWGNSQSGLRLLDSGSANPQTSATATNITAVDSGAAIRVFNSSLALDSSIVDTSSAGGTATCAITFSRGDSIGGDPTGCHDFSTAANPMLADQATGDLHLLPGSPMIDAGNSAAPGAGALDFDGDARALDATPECSGNVERRDMGADEWAPVLPDCAPPQTTLTKTPKKKTKKKRAKFEFESDEPVDATFMCKLDGAAYAQCASPLVWPVSVGKHTFRVFAIDAAGHQDPTPTEYEFKRRKRR